MNIVWLTSECHPFAKTGGLADVSASLPKALAKHGHELSVIMPYYPQVMDLEKVKPTPLEPLGVPFGSETEWALIHKYEHSKNLTYYFIEFNLFYDRPTLYDWCGTEYSDNAERYIFLSRAGMQAILALGLKPDILHANDWHTALSTVYLNSDLYCNEPNFKNCRSCLTIHNIAYQGVFNKSNLFWTGLDWRYFNYQCLEYYDQINLLKAGILGADMVNLVSPSYATEVLSPEFGCQLEGTLQHKAAHGQLRGIINGIDTTEWNPSTDKHLPATYSRHDLIGKAVCKEYLQKKMKLKVQHDIPIIGLISRLAYQKGIDVLLWNIDQLLETENLQFAILGSGDPHLEYVLSDLKRRYPGRFSAIIGYDEALSHLIEAGSDFFVMPSRYEPCGLNQMYSMRYGTLPIVRATGGLDDTVINYDPSNINNSTGFKFWDLTSDAVHNTIRWAVHTYEKNKDAIYKMRQNGMKQDFSWDHTASEYERLYADAHK